MGPANDYWPADLGGTQENLSGAHTDEYVGQERERSLVGGKGGKRGGEGGRSERTVGFERTGERFPFPTATRSFTGMKDA